MPKDCKRCMFGRGVIPTTSARRPSIPINSTLFLLDGVSDVVGASVDDAVVVGLGVTSFNVGDGVGGDDGLSVPVEHVGTEHSSHRDPGSVV